MCFFMEKDMAKEFSKWFYNSSQWRKTRKAFIKYRQSIDGGLCEMCKEKMGYIVDHKIELTPYNINNPDISLSFNNFQYLCHNCHNKKTFRKWGEQKYEFDDNGMVVPKLKTPPY